LLLFEEGIMVYFEVMLVIKPWMQKNSPFSQFAAIVDNQLVFESTLNVIPTWNIPTTAQQG
jgi:hypothetical protein